MEYLIYIYDTYPATDTKEIYTVPDLFMQLIHFFFHVIILDI
jgi:hypothetical protein